MYCASTYYKTPVPQLVPYFLLLTITTPVEFPISSHLVSSHPIPSHRLLISYHHTPSGTVAPTNFLPQTTSKFRRPRKMSANTTATTNPNPNTTDTTTTTNPNTDTNPHTQIYDTQDNKKNTSVDVNVSTYTNRSSTPPSPGLMVVDLDYDSDEDMTESAVAVAESKATTPTDESSGDQSTQPEPPKKKDVIREGLEEYSGAMMGPSMMVLVPRALLERWDVAGKRLGKECMPYEWGSVSRSRRAGG
ncbi:hypothetical protein BDN72DRAFT_847206, partial [Pluteus cervinus]